MQKKEVFFQGFLIATLCYHRGRDDETWDVVIEAPHAAATDIEWDTFADQLRKLGVPKDVIGALHRTHTVNADLASGPIGLNIGQAIAGRFPGKNVAVLLCHLPRSVVDTNRLLDAPGITPRIPDEIDPEGEAWKWLDAAHGAYLKEADALWEALTPTGCGFCSHTYAPWTVQIEEGETASQAVERFYNDSTAMSNAEKRVAADIICQRRSGEQLTLPVALPHLQTTLRDALPDGEKVGVNHHFPMHESVAADRRARQHPGQVSCVEVRRDLVIEGGWEIGREMPPNPNMCEIIGKAIAKALITAYFA